MANPTTNYGFVMPTSTDLVTDLPADFGVFGQAVDTQMFTNANAAIAKTIVDAKGDIIAATAADTVSRLAVGANNTVLTADSTAATGLKWATPTVASGMTFINSTSFTAQSGVNVDSVFSSTYDFYQIILSVTGSAVDDLAMQFRTGGTTNTNSNYYTQELQADSTTVSSSRQGPVTTGVRVGKNNTVRVYSTIFLQNPFASFPTGVQSLILNNAEGLPNIRYHVGNFSTTTSFDGFRLLPNSGTITGTVTTFGMAKS